MRSSRAQAVADYPLRYEYSYSYRGFPVVARERFPYPRPRTLLQEIIVWARRRSRKARTFWSNWFFHQGSGSYASLREMQRKDGPRFYPRIYEVKTEGE